MRILHVTDCYLPRLGGIESQVADLVHHQGAAGHDVHVLTSTSEPDNTTDCVYRIHTGWLRQTILASNHVMRLVAELRPDVVHCHNSVLSPLAVAVASAAPNLGIPTAVTVHSLLPPWGPLLPMSGSLLGLRGTPIAWSAVSEVAAMPVRHVLGRRAHVDVLPNAVDVGWWRDATPSSPADGRRTVTVVSVGRLAVRKRPLHLIDMMARVRERVSAEVPIRLVLVGDGPQRRRVERRVRHLGMSDWVDLPGQLTRAEIRDVLVDSDVYAAPATLESFGIAALEARSVGLPVVAKAQGGVGEFVANGTDGVLARTDQDMAEALALLIESLTLRTEIRTHNIAVAPALGWGEALSRADALYARASSLVGHSSGLVPTGPLLPAPEFQAAQ